MICGRHRCSDGPGVCLDRPFPQEEAIQTHQLSCNDTTAFILEEPNFRGTSFNEWIIFIPNEGRPPTTEATFGTVV
jgi:hypothetical protein